MTRGKDGEIHLLVNRCAHRGNLVCDAPSGNSSSFRCPYHGWTYRNTGELLGYPYNKGYGGKNNLELKLGVVPRVESYHGFVFASFNADVPPLVEHLGAAAGELDRLARLSPEGTVSLDAGWLRHRTHANWKLLAENETDGYHPQFVHGSIFAVTGSTIGPLYSDNSTAVTRAFGNGHSENDLRPEFRKFAEPMRWFGTTEDRVPDYVAAMRAKHGAGAEEILIEGAPHVMIFPNLVRRRNSGVQHSADLAQRMRSVLDCRATRRCSRTQQADAVAVDRFSGTSGNAPRRRHRNVRAKSAWC